MTDSQIIAIAITVLAILGGTLVNNSRIGDLHKRIDDTKDLLRAEIDLRFAQLDLRLDARFSSIDRKLDEILRIVGDHETRISSLEQRSR